MKVLSIIIAIAILWALTSCNTTTPVEQETTVLETKQTENMAKEITGTIVVETNVHPLANKTLNFDVEMVNITKWGSGTTTDIVEAGDKVDVHYTGTLEDGEKFDSSLDRGETLWFTVGNWEMIPGFDAGVVGMKEGEKKTLVLKAKDAYGESRPQTIEKKDLESFINAGIKLEVGEKLPTQYGELPILEVNDK